jgi:F0F1-type ATP synthase membrane subunit b/b'
VGGSVETGRYDRAERTVEDIRLELTDLVRLRDDADERLERVGETLARADATLAEARRARGEVLAKIAATEVPTVPGPASAMRERLAQAEQLRRHGRWSQLGPLLDTLEAASERELERARESLTSVTAPLAVRAELRGRLDAYKAMAARLGVAEDPELIERYDLARRMLWSAPCDLRAAEYAVLRYQQGLRAVQQQQATGPVDGRPYGA